MSKLGNGNGNGNGSGNGNGTGNRRRDNKQPAGRLRQKTGPLVDLVKHRSHGGRNLSFNPARERKQKEHRNADCHQQQGPPRAARPLMPGGQHLESSKRPAVEEHPTNQQRQKRIDVRNLKAAGESLPTKEGGAIDSLRYVKQAFDGGEICVGSRLAVTFEQIGVRGAVCDLIAHRANAEPGDDDRHDQRQKGQYQRGHAECAEVIRQAKKAGILCVPGIHGPSLFGAG